MVTGGQPIRAVIFDVGGILEPAIDHVLMPEMAERLGLSRDELRRRLAAHAVALSRGRMTLRDFYANVAADGPGCLDPSALVDRHLAIYATASRPLDAEVLGLVERLRRRHLVACLTNTEIEVARLNRDRGLYGLFDRAFVSTELGLHKPEVAIYQRVLAELGCAPAEVVFTDDNPRNVEGARRAGMHAIHYGGFAGLAADLARLLGPVG